ncbi:MAG: hypothetical protein WC501_02270 [Candidatus Micrarchaeia archaeon]
MIGLINHLLNDFVFTEVNKAKSFAEDEVHKLGDMFKGAIEVGIKNAVEASMPVVLKTGFYLVGGVFFLYGAARFIDTLTTYAGLGFMIVGVLGLIFGLLIATRK